MLKAIDVNITTNQIETCHRLGKKKNVIVRVVNRKHCLKAMQNKNKLQSIDKNTIDIPNVNLFISDNSKLAFNCQKLKRDCEIEKCYTINGIFTSQENNKLLKIYHLKIFQNSSQSMWVTTLIMLNNLFLFSEIPCVTERKNYLVISLF